MTVSWQMMTRSTFTHSYHGRHTLLSSSPFGDIPLMDLSTPLKRKSQQAFSRCLSLFNNASAVSSSSLRVTERAPPRWIKELEALQNMSRTSRSNESEKRLLRDRRQKPKIKRDRERNKRNESELSSPPELLRDFYEIVHFEQRCSARTFLHALSHRDRESLKECGKAWAREIVRVSEIEWRAKFGQDRAEAVAAVSRQQAVNPLIQLAAMALAQQGAAAGVQQGSSSQGPQSPEELDKAWTEIKTSVRMRGMKHMIQVSPFVCRNIHLCSFLLSCYRDGSIATLLFLLLRERHTETWRNFSVTLFLSLMMSSFLLATD